jgi:hypothetical protein
MRFELDLTRAEAEALWSYVVSAEAYYEYEGSPVDPKTRKAADRARRKYEEAAFG